MVVSLVTSGLPGVERAVAEFAHAHQIGLQGAVPLASVARRDIAHLRGLTPVHHLRPKDAWERNLHLCDAALILCPPRLESLEVAFLVQTCQAWAIPYLLTPGLMLEPVLAWLDEVTVGREDTRLLISGPAQYHAPRLGARAMRVMQAMMEDVAARA